MFYNIFLSNNESYNRSFLLNVCPLFVDNYAKPIVLALCCLSLVLSEKAHALPKDGVVAAGNVGISTSANTLNINQQSAKAIVNWSGFDIQHNETVNIKQPSKQSVILNRIQGNKATQIRGQLNANGQVFLVNSNGITFSAGSEVNVGALVSSTLDIKDQDFLDANYTFEADNGGASIITKGYIHADTISLLGNTVINEGWLVARTNDNTGVPSVSLIAADKVKLSFGDNKQLSVAIERGTINGLVENKQLIQAQGGNVLLRAEALNDVFSASVNNSGVIKAQSIGEKNGSIVLLADMQTGVTTVGGTLDASATSVGKGGFIETSAAQVNVKKTAKVVASGNGDANGLWLIDPSDLIIDSDNAAAYNSSLNSGTDVSLNTVSNGTDSGNGDIFVYADIAWDTDNTTLTLQAERNIEIHADISASGANSGVILDTQLSYASGVSWNKSFTDKQYANANYVSYGDGGKITLTGHNAIYIQDGKTHQVINGNNDALTGKTVVDELQNIDPDLYRYVLGDDVDASSFSAIKSGLVSFDGLNHDIANLTITEPSTQSTGLFSAINSSAQSYLRNLHITGGIITGKENVGAFAGYAANLSTNNITNAAQVNGELKTGGLIGSLNNSNIVNSHNMGNVNGVENTGGISGKANNSLLSLTSNLADVNAIFNYTGGLIGYGTGSKSVIQYSHNSGSITGAKSVGGLVGRFSNSDKQWASVKESYSVGAQVSGTDKVGGLIGEASKIGIKDTYVIGNVQGDNTVAGLLGTAGAFAISSSYFSGEVEGSSQIAALVAVAAGYSFNDVFYNSSLPATSKSSGKNANITKRTTLNELTTASTYDAYGRFDFGACGSSSRWCILDGISLPGLNNARTTKYLDIDSIVKEYNQSSVNIPFTHHSADISDNALIHNKTALLLDSQDADEGVYEAYQLKVQGFDSAQYDVAVKAGSTLTITPIKVSVDLDDKVDDATKAVNQSDANDKVDNTTIVANQYNANVADLFAGDELIERYLEDKKEENSTVLPYVLLPEIKIIDGGVRVF
jgi:filamentous hemagglutinin family protein